MISYSDTSSLFTFGQPVTPTMAPILGASKFMEQESDMAYLRYLYPDSVSAMVTCIEEAADKLEYEGSPMFDEFPDREYFRRIARDIHLHCHEKKDPENPESVLLAELTEVLLYHEVLFRRNRYRSRKRLYF